MAFASTKEMLVLGILMAAALHCAAAANHTVGGSSGWIVPTSNALYDDWTGNATFKVGDTLVFNFATTVHNVLRVTQANYKSCTSTSPIETYNTGPATVQLNDTGAHYYICGFPGHCNGGQKVTITVSAASSTTPTPTSPTTPTSTTNTSDASYHSIPFMGIFFGVSAAFFSL